METPGFAVSLPPRPDQNGQPLRTLFGMIVFFCLGLVAFITVVGGIVCITDGGYDFAEYVQDLTQVYKLLVAAVLSAVGHAIVGRSEGR